jgi:cytochrome c oxidase assembly factor CtaG
LAALEATLNTDVAQALLSMPFFANAAYLKNVSRFWIWVVLTVPSTSLAFVFFRVWQRRERQRKVDSDARKSDPEVQSSNFAIDNHRQ